MIKDVVIHYIARPLVAVASTSWAHQPALKPVMLWRERSRSAWIANTWGPVESRMVPWIAAMVAGITATSGSRLQLNYEPTESRRCRESFHNRTRKEVEPLTINF